MIPVFLSAQVQPKDNSPYSRFGFGDLVDPNLVGSLNMGGLGATHKSNYDINPVNPASYSYLTMASLSIGLSGELSSISNNTETFKSWNGNFRYISLGFPLTNPINDILDRKKRAVSIGMNLTLAPFSNVGYNIQTSETDPNVGEFLRKYAGSGGTYKFHWGTSAKYKNLSAGINLGYLFGNIATYREVEFTGSENPYNNFFTGDYHVKGFRFDFGAMYDLVLNEQKKIEEATTKTKKITFGIHTTSPSGFSTVQDEFFFTSQSATANVDTVSLVFDVKGKGKLPANIGIGATYHIGSTFAIGINYETANWSVYENDAAQESLSNTTRISIGGFYSPDPQSYTNYLKRIRYQYGFHYKTDPRSIQSEEVKDIGVSFGFGLPFVNNRKVSNANIGIILGNRGKDTAIEEKYMQINFGFTFNDDEWFIKRKYN